MLTSEGRTATFGLLTVASLLVLTSMPFAAYAIGEYDDWKPSKSTAGPSGGVVGKELVASVARSRIRVSHPGGQAAGASVSALTSVDPDWEPPVCWYEPAFSPRQLKDAVATGEGGLVSAHVWWSNALWVDHYEKGGVAGVGLGSRLPGGGGSGEGYKNYNLGKKGMFWRSTVRDGMYQDSRSWDCGRVMFWQDAGTLPEDANAPTPETLAAFAYDKIKVPDTEIELKPAGGSTVNLPTWVWLDQATFDDVTVRAELPGTGLYAVTTAKPVALHLDPGTGDAVTFPAGGDCPVNEDGSIGAPYRRGAAGEDPPCGVRYLRATGSEPYPLTASVTWRISWEGTGGSAGRLPDGVFEGVRNVAVQEVQAVNR